MAVLTHRLDLRVALCAWLVIATGWLAGPSECVAEEPLPSEALVKAAFLVNFPKYVDWPAEAFAEPNAPIVIAVLGETRVTGEIEKVIAGRTANGRKLVLKRLVAGEPVGTCHVLFICAREFDRSPSLVAELGGASILTVGESDDFLVRGGVINLARQGERIALEVNLLAAGRARIKVSSKLLVVAGMRQGSSQ